MTTKVFAYEVTRSAVPGVLVGSCLIDVEYDDETVRAWYLWDSKSDHFSVGWAAVRRERLCAVCYGGEPKYAKVHGHQGGHGGGDRYRPTWNTTSGSTNTTTEEPK